MEFKLTQGELVWSPLYYPPYTVVITLAPYELGKLSILVEALKPHLSEEERDQLLTGVMRRLKEHQDKWDNWDKNLGKEE